MNEIRIATWPEGTGVNHVSTTWQVSDKEDFSHIMEESIRDEKYVTVFYSRTVVPSNAVYYARYIRHFDNGGSSNWSKTLKILPREAGSNVDLKPEVFIDEPSVKVEETNDSYIVSTGNFRCTEDGHKSTHWLVKDAYGNILFKSFDNTINKKELIILKSDLKYSPNMDRVSFEVAFRSSNDFESHFGSRTIVKDNFNLKFNTNTNFIPIHQDFIFNFEVLDISLGYKLDKYEFTDNEDNIIKMEVFEEGVMTLLVERELLRDKSTYYLKIYRTDRLEPKIITVYTNRNSNAYRVDVNFKYEEKYYNTLMSLNDVKQTVGEQFIDNGIPIATGGSKHVKLYNFDRRENTITVSDLPFDFLMENVYSNRGVNVKMLDSNRILVDSNTSENGKPEFKVYDYRYGTLISRILRNDESNEIDITNASTIANDRKLYYFTSVNGYVRFRVFDPSSGNIADLPNRPDIINLEANLVYIGNGRLLSFNGSNEKNFAYIYNIYEKTWINVTIVPEKYRNLKMTSFIRKDGKVVSFNTGHDTNDVLLFDPSNYSFSFKVNNLDDTINLNSTIRLRNGEFLRYNSDEENPVVYLYR